MSAVIRQTTALINDEPLFERICDLGGWAIDRGVFDRQLGDDVAELGHLMLFCLSAALEAPEWAQALTASYRRGLRDEMLREEFSSLACPTQSMAAAVPVFAVTEVAE